VQRPANRAPGVLKKSGHVPLCENKRRIEVKAKLF